MKILRKLQQLRQNAFRLRKQQQKRILLKELSIMEITFG